MPDIVIARYSENLSWIKDIPHPYKVIVYNKGEGIFDKKIVERIDAYYELPNIGREMDTYLRHMLQNMSKDGGDYTVFCQGNPLEHSPDFIELLKKGAIRTDAAWNYSCCWKAGYPPLTIIDKVKKEKGFFVRCEVFSLYNWGPIIFNDIGANLTATSYCKEYDLPNGTNIAQDFFTKIGLKQHASAAEHAGFGISSYGAIFGVPNKNVYEMPKGSLFTALKYCHYSTIYGSGTIGYVVERLWLHLFGRDFISLPNELITY